MQWKFGNYMVPHFERRDLAPLIVLYISAYFNGTTVVEVHRMTPLLGGSFLQGVALSNDLMKDLVPL
jgi:hypothetical protein